MNILIDSTPLGLLSNPNISALVKQCLDWEKELVGKGHTIVVAGDTLYETKRELTRSGKTLGLLRLDAYVDSIAYVEMSRDVWDQASLFWSDLRKQGQPTADIRALDFDTLLAAHAAILNATVGRTVIATSNVRHLARMVESYHWQDPFWQTI